MPVVYPTAKSPPPNEAAMSKIAPSPPPAAGISTNGASHQVGTRQATRSRTRTRQAQQPASGNMGAGPSRTSGSLPRYNSEDHPLSPHKLAARGYHSFQCLGIPFHVKRRYTFLRELGIGAYGCVALARDDLLDCNVAIKKVTRVFERDVLARRALREVAVLRHIGLCDNVTALLDFDTTFIEFNEIYLVLEASEADLSQIIRSGQVLSDAHLQYFVAQILRGVRYMHAANVIHRDLKPGNLLVNADCQLKVCDFGLARAFAHRRDNSVVEGGGSPSAGSPSPNLERSFPDSPKNTSNTPASPAGALDVEQARHVQTTELEFPGGPLTEYVATRWYRAPEIMLCFRRGYGEQIDMWSVGCILAELLGGKPIFAGKDYVDQIARINNVLGSPTEKTIAKIGSERAKKYILSLPNMPAVPFAKLYPAASGPAIDLLGKLLCWDPEDRISAQEALQHPWLKAYHKSNDKWSPPTPFGRFEEVEMLKTIGDFQIGLEREADEMRAELEALEAEEQAAAADISRLDSTATTATDESCCSEGAKDDKFFSSKGTRRTSRSVSSPGASPVLTPSSLATSANEVSPTYETDLTSASAPHSVTGSNSAKKSRGRVMDGLGLSQQLDQVDRASLGVQKTERRALDETLANHGLLCGDDKSQVDVIDGGKGKFRRRALTNAPSRLARLKRHGSHGDLGSRQVTRQVDELAQWDCERSVDVTRRSSLQREEHGQVTDQTASLPSWLLLSAANWAQRHGERNLSATACDAILASTSREGSDTTAVGFYGPGTATTAQHSPCS